MYINSANIAYTMLVLHEHDAKTGLQYKIQYLSEAGYSQTTPAPLVSCTLMINDGLHVKKGTPSRNTVAIQDDVNEVDPVTPICVTRVKLRSS